MKTSLQIGLMTVALSLWTGSLPSSAGVIIANAGFETPNLGSNFQYDPTGPGVGWTFTARSGIAANGSGFGVDGPGLGGGGSGAPAPEGTQVGFLQQGEQGVEAEISQSLSGFSAGDTYSFTFLAAQRPTSERNTDPINLFPQTIEVLLDSTPLGTFTPDSTSYTSFTTSSFTITDDLSHTLSFIGTNAAWIAAGMPASGSDNTAFIDSVSLSSVPEPASIVMGSMATVVGLSLAIGRRRIAGLS
jgi:hypothetical protein